jgi:hypothetical protein
MPAVLAAVVLAALYLVIDPPSADLAAQTYRVGLFDREGWIAWDNGWYGGHHLPGYSVLFSPLASALDLHLVAALSLVAATAAFAALARDWIGGRAGTVASLWFAASTAALVVSGRLPFALGVALATSATLALARGRAALAGALGALTALASPVAALFAALVAGSIWLSRRDRAAFAQAAAAVVVVAVLVVAFPEGGSEPFVASAFWPALAATLAAVALTRGTVRVAAVVYGLVLVAAFVLDTPLGGNAARLGALLGGPLAMAVLWERGRAVVALACVPLAYWVLYPPVRDYSQAAGDPARAASYYEPLLARLRERGAGTGPSRLEIPFTEGHWEAARVAPAIALARGWERQLDRRRNALFYEGELTAGRYHAWLRDNAIRWVALPDAPLDRSAREEAALIRRGTPYLHEVWRDGHWRLFAVRDPAPMNASAMGPDWFVTTGGTVRVHWTPYWAVVEGRGCVRRAAGDWTAVTPDPPGSAVRVAIRIAAARVLSRDRRCR